MIILIFNMIHIDIFYKKMNFTYYNKLSFFHNIYCVCIGKLTIFQLTPRLGQDVRTFEIIKNVDNLMDDIPTISRFLIG